MPAILSERTHAHRFVPDALDPTDMAAVGALYETLAACDIASREALEAFILDWEELNAVLNEYRVAAYVDMTSDTSNPDYEAHYMQMVEELVPLTEQRGFALKRKLLASPALAELGADYAVFLRNIRSEVALFREENVPLITEDLKLGQEFEKLTGNQQAELRGATYTMTELGRFLEEPDRHLREDAWRARAARALADAATCDALYDRMLKVRQRIAHNAGFAGYRDYRFQEFKRFDYTPDDCLAFHDAIERYVVPALREDYARRRRLLGVETLRPWDVLVDPENRPALRPFETVEQLQDGCARIFAQLDPELAGYFQQMIDERLLDLANRPGKAPGGYMDTLYDTRVPFIFMNAVGTRRDVETLLHEGGHSFHYFLARNLPLTSYHMADAEISEVASMTMELLARPYLGEFYAEADLAYVHDDQLRLILRLLTQLAMGDAFQHWVYTTPNPDAAARHAKWIELSQRFQPDVDWSGLEPYRGIGWQFLHIFVVPFYFVEYGIAQIAAVRIWLNSLRDAPAAVAAYKRGLALGGSRPLPELFRASGIEFGLDDRTVGPVITGMLAQLGWRAA